MSVQVHRFFVYHPEWVLILGKSRVRNQNNPIINLKERKMTLKVEFVSSRDPNGPVKHFR